MAKLSESRKRANKKWDEKNKQRRQYINKRSVARNFVKQLGTIDDLNELQMLIETRRKDLE